MLYHVRMDVRPQHDVDPDRFEALKAEEKAHSRELQRAGKWPHLWRIAGQYLAEATLARARRDRRAAGMAAIADAELARWLTPVAEPAAGECLRALQSATAPVVYAGAAEAIASADLTERGRAACAARVQMHFH